MFAQRKFMIYTWLAAARPTRRIAEKTALAEKQASLGPGE